jgi:tetratricopeptide (TPR) repeat protein
MNSKEPLGRLSDLFSRFNLMPTRPQSAQATEGFYGNLLAKFVRFKLILESEPNHVQSHGNLEFAYAGLGDRVAAVRHLDKAIELDPEYEPAIDNRCIILALPPGERLNCGQIREVDFYVDRERARRPHARQQYRFANRGDDMNSMPQASPASGLKST